MVIALIVTTDGLPLAYEVLPGNTADKTTLRDFLKKIENLYGKARRIWVMDRGIPTEETLEQMRKDKVAYLVGTPRSLLSKLEEELLTKPWEQVHEGVAVKLLEKDNEVYVQARSGDRQKKEQAMRRRKLKALLHGLNHLRHRIRRVSQGTRSRGVQKLTRDELLKKVAVLQKEAGRVAKFVTVREPAQGEAVTLKRFVCRFDRDGWKQSLQRDGCYILRASIPCNEEAQSWPKDLQKRAPVLWQWYMQLAHVEEAFKTLKSDLNLRPIHHQLGPRVEAHILVAFLGYCLTVTLRMKLQSAAPGLTPRAALQSLAAIQMVDVEVPTTDGRMLLLRRHTEPETEQQMVLQKLRLQLPAQPPPRIHAGRLPPEKAKTSPVL